jgi:hypothetical protein
MDENLEKGILKAISAMKLPIGKDSTGLFEFAHCKILQNSGLTGTKKK